MTTQQVSGTSPARRKMVEVMDLNSLFSPGAREIDQYTVSALLIA